MHVDIFDHDLSEEASNRFFASSTVAVDTETTGLDPASDRLCLVQVAASDGYVALVRFPDTQSARLQRLLSESGTSIFHFARFDLSFLSRHLGLRQCAVVCTKVSARITSHSDVSLAGLASEICGVELNKEIRLSDWTIDSLSDQMVCYAAQDVLYLHDLWRSLRNELVEGGLLAFAQQCFGCILTIAEADARGLTNLFEHD